MIDADLSATIRDLLVQLHHDPAREGLVRTPERVARFLREFVIEGGEPGPLTTFDAEGMNEMIVVGRVPFYSLCEHHLLPFFGTATIGYIPADRILGLSKLPRMVRAFAHGLQNQERLTQQIADRLMRALEPKGAGVVLHARHLCMEMRGIEVAGAATTTSALRGVFFEDARCRREFLDFDRNGGGK